MAVSKSAAAVARQEISKIKTAREPELKRYCTKENIGSSNDVKDSTNPIFDIFGIWQHIRFIEND